MAKRKSKNDKNINLLIALAILTGIIFIGKDAFDIILKVTPAPSSGDGTFGGFEGGGAGGGGGGVW